MFLPRGFLVLARSILGRNVEKFLVAGDESNLVTGQPNRRDNRATEESLVGIGLPTEFNLARVIGNDTAI